MEPKETTGAEIEPTASGAPSKTDGFAAVTESDLAASLEARWARDAEPAPKTPDTETPEERQTTTGEAEQSEAPAGESNREEDAEAPDESDDLTAVVPEDAEEDAGDEDAEDSESGGWPAAALERIGKLSRQRNEARERAESLESRAKELEEKLKAAERGQVRLNPTPENPLADLTTTEALEARERDAKAIIAWAEANPDGATATDADGNEREYSSGDVNRLLRQAERELERHIPERRKYLQAQAQADEYARARYPQLYAQGSEAEKFASSILRDAPGIVQAADHAVILGDAWVGALVRQGKFRLVPKTQKPEPVAPEPAGGKSREAAAKAPPTSPPPSAPRKSSGPTKAASEAQKRFEKTGHVNDLAAALEARLSG